MSEIVAEDAPPKRNGWWRGADASRPDVGPRSSRLEKAMSRCQDLHWDTPPDERARRMAKNRAIYLSDNLVSKGYFGKNEPIKAPPKLTSGSLRDATEAFVYVGRCRKTGRIKIGMSSNPLQRAKGLVVELLFTVPVVVAQAKLVETCALRRLGALVGDTEWVSCEAESAIDAVCAGWIEASKVAHVNPMITAEEARLDRVKQFSNLDAN